MEKIISINNLSIAFNKFTEVVKNVNIDVVKGKTTAIVGESGSGKTLSALSILKLLPNGANIKTGEIIYNNKNLLNLSQKDIFGILEVGMDKKGEIEYYSFKISSSHIFSFLFLFLKPMIHQACEHDLFQLNFQRVLFAKNIFYHFR